MQSGERDRGRSLRQRHLRPEVCLVETFLLLFSSITYGMAMIAMNKGKVGGVNARLFLTFLFGLGFVAMEIYEFHHLIAEGFGRIAARSCPASSRWSAPTVCT